MAIETSRMRACGIPTNLFLFLRSVLSCLRQISPVFEGNPAFGLDGVLGAKIAGVWLSALDGDPLSQAD